MESVVDHDMNRTPSKKRGSNSGLDAISTSIAKSHSSMDTDAETPESAFQSAYTAPPYPRPQADRDHQQESITLDRERGDLTAYNLELIPTADQVAPGIRLDRGGNHYAYQRRRGIDVEQAPEDEADGGREGQSNMRVDLDDHLERRENKAPSSLYTGGRSSAGGADQGDATGEGELEAFEDVDEEIDDTFEDSGMSLVHERVGGSGATAENASKGTSVGHFGPLGEAIPGVPPHLDPRQPHFRPPSPGAASIVSVAVHPPASPKGPLAGGLGSSSGLALSSLADRSAQDIIDSGEETESFDNGVLTPTLSEEYNHDDMDDADQGDTSHYMDASSSSKASPVVEGSSLNPFRFDKMQLGGGPQVSFSTDIPSERQGSISSVAGGRAPSIAATAGSSRAPSTRGLSPPASLSRTTEGSSMEEFNSSTGEALSGVETPNLARSRQSSYSAPSSEVEPSGQGEAMGADVTDLNTRARGGTLVASPHAMAHNLSQMTDADENDDNLRDGPSLAPSEAGSDSVRSYTHDSSGIGPHMHFSSERTSQRLMPNMPSLSSSSAPYEPPSPLDTPSKSGLHPMLPSLLAIKKASARNGSGAASTSATAGTASPASSLSVDGDFEDATQGMETVPVE